ncbi:MAG: Lrp/AsnC ligand binding domain-containing protein [Candidatus Bathyarchaeia archaeon]
MDKALVLITLKLEYSTNLLENLKEIPGVIDADLIYGPYDAYTIVETDTSEELRDAVLKMREIYGVDKTLTCSVLP